MGSQASPRVRWVPAGAQWDIGNPGMLSRHSVVEEAESGWNSPEPQPSQAGLGLKGATQAGLDRGPQNLGQDYSPLGKKGPLQEGMTLSTVRVCPKGRGLQPDCRWATAILSALTPVFTVPSAVQASCPEK